VVAVGDGVTNVKVSDRVAAAGGQTQNLYCS
jgi:NADPH:quinone reductase-like Zn-dependent oxidoreductase